MQYSTVLSSQKRYLSDGKVQPDVNDDSKEKKHKGGTAEQRLLEHLDT